MCSYCTKIWRLYFFYDCDVHKSLVTGSRLSKYEQTYRGEFRVSQTFRETFEGAVAGRK